MSNHLNRNIIDDKIKQLSELFPSVVINGQIDFDKLRAELGEVKEVERYGLNWSGKQKAKRIWQEGVVGKTLSYIESESKNPNTTENLYIEGDNLEVMKLLKENYYGAIKMIYIDPPYNTGNDFIYKDNFKMDKLSSDIAEGVKDNSGGNLEQNPKTSNRYHADWLSMMYPRLKLARQLLKDDGVIFISIDDNEVANLRLICDEIFGSENFINLITVKMSEASGVKMSHSNKLPKLKEYILVYNKNKLGLNKIRVPKAKWDEEYNLFLENLTLETLDKIDQYIGNFKGYIQDTVAIDELLKNVTIIPISKKLNQLGIDDTSEQVEWKFNNAFRICRAAASDSVHALALTKLDKTQNAVFAVQSPKNKIYITKRDFNKKAKKPRLQLLFAKDYLDITLGDLWVDITTTELANEGSVEFKNGKKPLKLMSRLLKMVSSTPDDIILDFFSGSATTAHAVMQLNAEDGGKRKFIMVQYPELVKDNTGYANICEIGKERIRRAGEKIKSGLENASLDSDQLQSIPDIGFKVFKVADTNINWNQENFPSIMNQLDMDISNIDIDKIDFTEGWSDIDIVYELMLKQKNISLSSKIELIEGYTRTFLYGSLYLVCLETEITSDLIETLSELNPIPRLFLFRDSAFRDDIDMKEQSVRRLQHFIQKNAGVSKKVYTIDFI
ncbi:MAG: hypothetical protein BEN18_09500 [Epulopiscium sp. Nuni2H_MBin001]|nr:MAG: hypothetical protein BEN18_09500 [Epulopiscium sp. Nuni2H_MBin001]